LCQSELRPQIDLIADPVWECLSGAGTVLASIRLCATRVLLEHKWLTPAETRGDCLTKKS